MNRELIKNVLNEVRTSIFTLKISIDKNNKETAFFEFGIVIGMLNTLLWLTDNDQKIYSIKQKTLDLYQAYKLGTIDLKQVKEKLTNLEIELKCIEEKGA